MNRVASMNSPHSTDWLSEARIGAFMHFLPRFLLGTGRRKIPGSPEPSRRVPRRAPRRAIQSEVFLIAYWSGFRLIQRPVISMLICTMHYCTTRKHKWNGASL